MTKTAWVSKTDEERRRLYRRFRLYIAKDKDSLLQRMDRLVRANHDPGQENWTVQEKNQRENHHIQENQDRRFRLEQPIYTFLIRNIFILF